MKAIGYGAPEQDYDFWSRDANGNRWDNIAAGFVPYNAGNFINYRIAAAETSPGEYEADVPEGTVIYQLRHRGVSAKASVVLWVESVSVEVEVDAEEIAGAVVSALGSGQVTVVSPTTTYGNKVALTLIRGDSYTGGRAIYWTNAEGTWPDLTDATIVLTIRVPGKTDAEATLVLEAEGTVEVPTGESQRVSVELDSETTEAAPPGTGYVYDIQATLTGGEVVTIVGPNWPATIVRDQTVPVEEP